MKQIRRGGTLHGAPMKFAGPKQIRRGGTLHGAPVKFTSNRVKIFKSYQACVLKYGAKRFNNFPSMHIKRHALKCTSKKLNNFPSMHIKRSALKCAVRKQRLRHASGLGLGKRCEAVQ